MKPHILCIIIILSLCFIHSSIIYNDITIWDNYEIVDHIVMILYGNVKYLVSVGADIHARDDDPLRRSANRGHLEVVKYLISIGANIHADNEYALIWSAEDGHLDVVKYLLSIGADINIFDDFILRCIDTNGHKEVINYLLSVAAK